MEPGGESLCDGFAEAVDVLSPPVDLSISPYTFSHWVFRTASSARACFPFACSTSGGWLVELGLAQRLVEPLSKRVVLAVSSPGRSAVAVRARES
ncbi:hypothetical protein AB0C84_44855 [Actinomadura sp. NPDC048955]|uniref:hypothetical protein n=1 Tax=Actinomadura sp. NPDC048955 TaxID=3158228 RepID=UPI0033D08148